MTFEARPLTSPPQSETGTETGVAAADDHFATTLVQRVVQHDTATGAFVTAERWVAVRAPYGDKYQAKLQWAVWPAGLGGAHLQVCHTARTSVAHHHFSIHTRAPVEIEAKRPAKAFPNPHAQPTCIS